jgi:threonine synthase
MQNLRDKGIFQLEDMNISDFYGNYANEDEISSEIKRIYKKYNYLIDPHTAVSSEVYRKYVEEYKDCKKTVIVSTASPFKFPEKVASSIEMNLTAKDVFFLIKELSEKTGVNIPLEVKVLNDKKIYHKEKAEKYEMKECIMKFLKVGIKND